jgi:ribosomal protein L37E
VDKDPVFGKKKQNQRIGHCGASSGFFQKKSLKTCGFYERTGKESAVSFMA